MEEAYSSRSIREWREDDRPREKLLKNGPGALSDSELLAILIRSGTHGRSALEVARNLLEKYDSIASLAKRDVSEICSVKGLGPVKAVEMAAAFEISRRVAARPAQKLPFSSPETVAECYIPMLRHELTEKFLVLLLNSANLLIKDVLISKGSINQSIVHPREVFRKAIIESAVSIILLHNHPSGDPTPSAQDKQLTKRLVQAGELIGIKVVDHVIIAGETYSSFLKLSLL